MTASADPTAPAAPQALILRRLLALFYDFWPVLALWMLLSLLFNVGFTLAGHDRREVLETLSPLGVLLWLGCWLIAGAYATHSWARGGQTLGMRPWRLRVVGAGDADPTRKALWTRYTVGTLSLLLGGLGFWWAWIDREKRTWHDRASGTRMVAVPKRKP
ncbi:MAG: RDD family protein [Pseudomonadota bacterium]